MSAVVRLYNINSPNEFTISIKKGNSAYPLLGETDYTYYGTYDGGTTEVEIDNYTFENNQQYWIQLVDTVVHGIDPKRGFINENLYIDSNTVYDVEVNTLFIYVPSTDVLPTPPPSITPSITPTIGLSPTPTPTITPTPSLISYRYIGSLVGQVTSTLACLEQISVNYYSDTPNLVVGVIMYEDSPLTTPFNGQTLWYKMTLEGSGMEYVVEIEINTGVILQIETCPLLPLTQYCYNVIYNCGDIIHCDPPEYTNCAWITWWDEYGIEHYEDNLCKDDYPTGYTVWSAFTPLAYAMSTKTC